MKIKTLIFFTFLTCIAFSQDDKHPIDIKLEKCLSLDSNMTTYGMLNCIQESITEWEEVMNKYYSLLMSKIDAEQQNRLKEAQENWVEFKNAEIKFSNSTYYSMEGSMWLVVGLNNQKEIYKRRAMDLEVYYYFLTFE
jgi:uncharacterized protein YecT (DUF1311 family)